MFGRHLRRAAFRDNTLKALWPRLPAPNAQNASSKTSCQSCHTSAPTFLPLPGAGALFAYYSGGACHACRSLPR